MGKFTFSSASYTKSRKEHSSGPGRSSTYRAEQQARETGKLDPLVDPSGYGVIRESRPRLEKLPNGLWKLLVGPPMPIETRVDTTGSMGHNVDVALEVLPNMHEACSDVLPGYDLQIATGIFGDVGDNFPLCRPQFEMHAEKIVQQLTLMVPERGGGDFAEDPHYGLFGAAYLTAAHICRLGLKSYDFTVSDAPARDQLDERELIRIFGPDVFKKGKENGHEIDRRYLLTREVVQDLLERAHAFFLQVGDNHKTASFWTEVFGSDRVVMLPSTQVLPQVQATIIGLTEDRIDLGSCVDFLRRHNVSATDAKAIQRSVANIPIGEQAGVPIFKKFPQKGDLFRNKTDPWPVEPDEVRENSGTGSEEEDSIEWV